MLLAPNICSSRVLRCEPQVPRLQASAKPEKPLEASGFEDFGSASSLSGLGVKLQAYGWEP